MFLLVLIAVPVAEVLAFVGVGLAVGWALAVALLIGCSLAGLVALRTESRAALSRLSLAAAGAGPLPATAVEAALGLLGAVLLLVPGFVTGALGVVLLLPAARRGVRRLLSRHLARRVMGFAVVAERFGMRSRPADVDGTAVDDDLPQLGR
jgi:UPF0716 protein FxsA